MGQVTSRCERRRSIRLPPIATEESYGSSVCSVRTGHSIDSNRFEQSLSYVLTEHGLRVTSNIFYDESMNILDNTAALHDARIFILQVHQQRLKHLPSVRQKWQVHKDGLRLAGLRAYINAVDKWFDAGGKPGKPPPAALGRNARVLYEVDMMSEPDPERPAQVELPQVAARLEGYAELTTLQKIIREKLQTLLWALICRKESRDRSEGNVSLQNTWGAHQSFSTTECRMPILTSMRRPSQCGFPAKTWNILPYERHRRRQKWRCNSVKAGWMKQPQAWFLKESLL